MGLSGFGGKGSTPTAPAPGGSPGMDLEMLMGMMGMMSEMSKPEMPKLPDPPGHVKTTKVDWTDKQAQLAAKAAADYHLDQKRKMGRNETIHTSPLLDEEEPATTGSIMR